MITRTIRSTPIDRGAVAAHSFARTGTTRQAPEITTTIAGEAAAEFPSLFSFRTRPAFGTQLLNLAIQARNFIPQLVKQPDHFTRRTAIAWPVALEMGWTIIAAGPAGSAWPVAPFGGRTTPKVVGSPSVATRATLGSVKTRTIAAVASVAACVAWALSVAWLIGGNIVVVARHFVIGIVRRLDFTPVINRLALVVIGPERRGEPSDT